MRMDSADKLRTRLLDEIKKETWRNGIDDEVYATNNKIVDEIRQKNLQVVTKHNKEFHITKTIVKRKKTDWKNTVNKTTLEAYEKWKRENYTEDEYPKVSAEKLLNLLYYLSTGPNQEHKKKLKECLRRQNSTFKMLWNSPSTILKALNQCVLTRDWQNMTYLILLLLNYDKKYLVVIRSMCKIMVKFNPLIKQCDLEDQFKILTEDTPEDITIV